MPHIITGEIRKDVYTQEGNGAKGAWKMYGVELSESFKDKKTGERVYTNYRATFFANDATRSWYDEAFQKGRVISVSCAQLQVNQRESDNGRVFITLECVRPELAFSQREPQQGGGWGQPQQPTQNQFSGQQQPAQRQPAQQQSAPSNQNQPPMDFDDDIPF